MIKVACLVLVTASVAHAEPTPQERAKALLELQAKAINANDQEGLDATFARDVIALDKHPVRMCALAIAQLDGSGAPTIVAVQYVGSN